jgi:Uma2 family endonuclease
MWVDLLSVDRQLELVIIKYRSKFDRNRSILLWSIPRLKNSVPPELAIEIISPGQTFGQMTQKASNYLTGGVLQVWVVDPVAQSITVFYPVRVASPLENRAPVTYMGDSIIIDDLFPELAVALDRIF